MYAMMSEASRRELGESAFDEHMRTNGPEIQRLAEVAASDEARLEATAALTFDDGQRATLVLEGGRFRVQDDTALPVAAQSPTAALRQLRSALQRRSYLAFLRVLSRETRWVVESELQALIDALEEPGELQIQVRGRRATASLPGGHTVTLESEDGVWTIKDFD